MNRRALMAWLAAVCTSVLSQSNFLAIHGARASQQPSPKEDILNKIKQIKEAEARALADIPFRRVETTGQEALAVWERLRKEEAGWPVIVGNDKDLLRIAQQLQGLAEGPRKPEDILAAASSLRFPEDLRRKIEEDDRASSEQLQKLMKGAGKWPEVTTIDPGGQSQKLPGMEAQKFFEAGLAAAKREPAVGEWPDDPSWVSDLSVIGDYSQEYFPKVHILVLPTSESAAVPAFLQWGGWNSCPLPEHHVAALRSWHERYGAELIGLSGDVMNLRVKRRPSTRDEALAIAREQFLYCQDIVWQGTGTLAPLATTLLNGDWWYFWWD